MLHKLAVGAILGARIFDGRTASLMRTAHRAHFDYEPKYGMLYVRSRMISSRCNDNFDEFPADEIERGYMSFLGKPVFVNHHNEDHRRARGLILDAALHKDALPNGAPDTWVEGLMEIDALTFPRLAQAVVAGHIDRTSMGVDVAFSVCAVCSNRATTPLEYCRHIPAMKGSKVLRATAGGRVATLVRERCHGLSFFENSLLVEDPADPTAYTLGTPVLGPGLEHLSTHMPKTAGRKVQIAMTGNQTWTMSGGHPQVDVSPGPISVNLPSRTAARGPVAPTPEIRRGLPHYASGGTCPSCLGRNTISALGAAECFDCEATYALGSPPLVREAKPRYEDPGEHPFFQANPAHADHIMKVWHQGTEDEHEQGRRWYADAGLVAKALGTLHHGQHPAGNTHLAAGLIANYSPQTGWAANQHNAARALHDGKGLGGKGSGIFASDQQRKAADRMLGGEHHTAVLTSPKVSDFAHLVEHGGDKDPEHPHVVVDRHALSVATGRRMSDDDYGAFPKTQRHYYGHVVGAYHEAARRISEQTGIPHAGHQVQAATWLTQQRLNQKGEEERAAADPSNNTTRLDKGRHKSREKQEQAWSEFRQQHLPDLDANPGTGYGRSAARGRRGRP